jgi:cytochrome c biogenesis protein ResB
VPLCPPQIPHWLTQTFSVRCQQLTFEPKYVSYTGVCLEQKISRSLAVLLLSGFNALNKKFPIWLLCLKLHSIIASLYFYSFHVTLLQTSLTWCLFCTQIAKVSQYEEKISSLREEKVSLEKQLALSHSTMTQLQHQNNALVAELGEPQRRLSQLHEASFLLDFMKFLC